MPPSMRLSGLLLLCALLAGCTSTSPRPATTPRAAVESAATGAAAAVEAGDAALAGTWRYTMETPAGASGGYYVFRVEGGVLTGDVRRALAGEPGGDAPPRPMQNVARDGDRLTFSYEAGNYGALTVDLSRTGPDTFAGQLYVGQSALPLTVARVR